MAPDGESELLARLQVQRHPDVAGADGRSLGVHENTREGLAPDGSLAAEYNSDVCTPSKANGAWAGRMLTYAKNGWIVNETADARAAQFKINANDPNRLDYQVQYTRIGNLIVDAGVLQFVAA